MAWSAARRRVANAKQGIVEKFKDKQLKLDWHVDIGSGYSGPTIADGRVFVTDRLVEPTQVERVHCFDWKTGHELWTYPYDCRYSGVGYEAGPRAAVTIDDGPRYALKPWAICIASMRQKGRSFGKKIC